MCGFMIVKPPMNGARRGPVNTVIEKTVMARPRVRALNMSEKTAATTASGQEAKTPPKKRQMRTVWRSFPTAEPIEKIEKPNMAIINGSFLPRNSESGAHKSGPVANPSTYNDNPSIPTSVETPNCSATAAVAAEKMLLAKAAVNVVYPSMTARNILFQHQQPLHQYPNYPKQTHFFLIGQFCGCKGSSGPSNSTT